MSKKVSRNRLALAMALLLSAPMTQAQTVYSEDFTDASGPCNAVQPGTYPFPSDWLLRNVDNLTPNSAVSYVNAAWRVREDFTSDVTNCVAISTSWYTPAGTSNDWMWTPLINIPAVGAGLSWRARAPDSMFPDGYEVRVMPAVSGPPSGSAGVIGNQISASTVVFTTAAEAGGWTTRQVSLAAFAGQGVYVGFRNNTDNKFLLLVDDVTVVALALAAVTPKLTSPYARIPTGLAYVPQLGVNASNIGGVGLTNVRGSATLMRGAVANGMANATALPALAAGVNTPLVFPTPLGVMAGDGSWTVSYNVIASESEPNMADNTIVSAPTIVGGSELARYEGNPVGSLGIDAGNGGELGVQFTLPQPATIVGIGFAVIAHPVNPLGPDTWLEEVLVANLRAFDSVAGKPGAVIATTVEGITTRDAASYALAFAGGPQLLPAGTYVATLVEPVGTRINLGVFTHTNRYLAGTAWVNWPTNPNGDWSNFEVFNFLVTPRVSLLTSFTVFRDGFETAAAPGRASVPVETNGDLSIKDATTRVPHRTFVAPAQ